MKSTRTAIVTILMMQYLGMVAGIKPLPLVILWLTTWIGTFIWELWLTAWDETKEDLLKGDGK